MARTTRRGRPPHEDLLTPAEWRTVHAVQHGMSNRQIAQRRGLSIDAVKYHVRNAVAKLGVGSRRDLKQWFETPRHSLLSTRKTIMPKPLELGPLAQIARSVRDIKESESWYRERLGLKHLFTFGALAVEFGAAPHMIHRHADGTEEWLASFTDPEGRPLALLAQARPDAAAREGA
jgi:DNA-binding CsgD family transcriptional regulator